MDFQEVLQFWFEELTPSDWWAKNPELDKTIKLRFGDLHRKASAGELHFLRDNAKGSLAEIIILDQFSRNIYRNDKNSYAFDGMALVLAQEAIRKNFNRKLPPMERAFMYLPFMHSESINIHQDALRLFSEPGLEDNLKFEREHLQIIERFGRYPHRNAIIGRISSEQEKEFINSHPGF